MRFRLRRRSIIDPTPIAAPGEVAPSAPASLGQDELFALVHERLARFVGADGAWVVTRRSHDDRDPIFHGMLARSLAHELSDAIHAEQVRAGVAADVPAPVTAALAPMRAAGEPVTAESMATDPGAAARSSGHAVDPAPAAAPAAAAEPAALGWTPAPIAVWAEPVEEQESAEAR